MHPSIHLLSSSPLCHVTPRFSLWERRWASFIVFFPEECTLPSE